MSDLWLPLLLGEADPTEHIRPHPLHVGGISLSNTIVMLCLAGVLMLLLFPLAARKKDRIPRGVRNFVESALEFIREGVARPSLREATDRYVPILWTVFFLILFANLLGALPIGALWMAITGHKTHFGGTATGDFSVTVGLAVCAFVLIHVAGFREHGVGYCKSFAPHVPWPLLFLLVPLEIFGSFVKPFALAIRLFANMIAGHIVLAILLGFAGMLADAVNGVSVSVTVASVAGSVFISLLELFVAFLQAYVFTFLTTLFLGMAVHPEH